jgi:GYF domain 2
MSEFYLFNNKTGQEGPFSREEVGNKLSSGTIEPDSLIWNDEMGDWKPIADVWGKERQREILDCLLEHPEGMARDKITSLLKKDFDQAGIPHEVKEVFHLESSKGFWDQWYGKLIRWIGFIPVTVLELAIVNCIGAVLLGMIISVFSFKTTLSLGTIILGIILVSVGGTFVIGGAGLYFYSIFIITKIGAQRMCPHPKIGAIFLGLILLLYFASTILVKLNESLFLIALFHTATFVAVVMGLISAYRETEFPE